MSSRNVFLPKRILPEFYEMHIHSLSIKELSEVNSMLDFLKLLDELNEWSIRPGNYFPQKRYYCSEISIEEIPLFIVEITFLNNDERRLKVRFLTDLDLLEFISSLEFLFLKANLEDAMESKGVPLLTPA
jgi:hypothetical protein